MKVLSAVIMADRRVLRSSVILSSFLVLASYISNLNSLKRFGNAQTLTWESFSSMDAAYLVELQLNPLTYLKWAGGHLVIFCWKRFQSTPFQPTASLCATSMTVNYTYPFAQLTSLAYLVIWTKIWEKFADGAVRIPF